MEQFHIPAYTTARRRPGNFKSLVIDEIIKKLTNFWHLLGASVVLIYIWRGSVLSLWSGDTEQFLRIGVPFILSLCGILVISRNWERCSVPGLWLIALTLPGSLTSADASQSVLNWAAWALLFSVAGPLVSSRQLQFFRAASWSTVRLCSIVIACASLVWYVMGLPNLGRGAFTGVMLHSMLLGPLAAIACLFVVHKAIWERSFSYLFLAALVMLSSLLAGSRTALIGLTAGVLVLVYFYICKEGFKKSIPLISIVFVFGLLSLLFQENIKPREFLYQYTLTLQNKGINNSRSELWKARLIEFGESPVVGIGMGMGKVTKYYDGVTVNASGKINVEPGSSYLAVLSMTGLLGALGLCYVDFTLLRRPFFPKNVKSSCYKKQEVLAVTVFFLVHMIAEGYIFAIGNFFCFVFWLCLGRIRDLSPCLHKCSVTTGNHLAPGRSPIGVDC